MTPQTHEREQYRHISCVTTISFSQAATGLECVIMPWKGDNGDIGDVAMRADMTARLSLSIAFVRPQHPSIFCLQQIRDPAALRI